MATSDAAFLAEVDRFLSWADQVSVSDNDDPPAALAPSESPPSRRRTTPVDAEEQSNQQKTKAKARSRRRAYLERQKLHREELKRQVAELTAQLGRERCNVSSATSAWKVLAARQRELRQDAEEQQRRLCVEVAARAALIRKFRGFLNDRLGSVDNVGVTEPPTRHKRVRLEPSDAELYEVYEKELEALYAQTDTVLHDCELDAVDGDGGDSKQTWTRNTQSGHFQFTDKHVVPFAFDETCRSRWVVAHMLHRQEDRQLYDEIEDGDNTVALKFRLRTSFASGKVASVLQRIVIRRYKMDERMVIVWRSFMEGEGIFTGLHADETGWGVATPVASGTMLRTCVRSVLMHFNSVAMHEPVAKQFTGVVLDSGAENNSEITNALAKLLLKDE